MAEIGYALSSEEHRAKDLVRYARRAEEAGFTFALISDHFHPWTDKQGQSPFVWSVLGGIAQQTKRLRVGTGVTCPTIRVHPAIVAQAAATVATMMPGRFFLGVGTGENLNEHIFGDKWPRAEVRLEMLEEAMSVMRLLWQGGTRSHEGKHYTVENARIYSLPDEPPPIFVAGAGRASVSLAARAGDGFIGTSPKREMLERFDAEAGTRKPKIGQFAVCWAEDEAAARRIAHEWWPTAGLHGQVTQELPTPALFEQAAKNVTKEQIAEMLPCGPDPRRHLETFEAYADAGYDEVYVHQIGPDQEGFFRFYEREIIPKVAGGRSRAA